MKSDTADEVRRFIISFLNTKLHERGCQSVGELTDDYDLLLSGVVDSLGFVELITAAAGEFGRTLNLDSLDPEQMTIVGPLCAFVSSQPCA